LSTYFSVGQGGPVNIQNTRLELNNQNITGVGGLELPQQGPENDPVSNENRFWLDTDTKELKVQIGGKIYTSEIQPEIPNSLAERNPDNDSFSTSGRYGITFETSQA